MSCQDINLLRKEGKLEEAKKLADKMLEASPDDIWCKRGKAWVLYEYLKKIARASEWSSFEKVLDEILELGLPAEDELFYTQIGWQVNKFLFELERQNKFNRAAFNAILTKAFMLNWPRPSEVYSLFLKAVLKAKDSYDHFKEFLEWWNWQYFRQEDFQPEEFNGRSIMPLAERVIYAYSKHLLAGERRYTEENPFEGIREIDREAINRFLPFLEGAMEQHPAMTFIPFYMAKLRLALDEEADVLETLRPFIRQKGREFWVWQLLAEAFPHDPDYQLACYCKALSCPAPAKFLVKVRKELAAMLIEQQLFSEAKIEIEALVRARKAEGWKTPNQIRVWQQQPWYQQAKSQRDNRNFYRRHIPKVEAILYDNIPEKTGIVESVNLKNKRAYFRIDKRIHGNFKYKVLGRTPKEGELVALRLEERDSRDGRYYHVLTVRSSSGEAPGHLVKNFSGKVMRSNSWKFALVDGCFIPPVLVAEKQLEGGKSIRGKALLNYNKKKKEWGWKVFEICKP